MTTPDHADLYADLGLTREASRAEITRAYRALIREHHPDTRPHHPGPNSACSHSAAANSGASSSGLASSSDEILNRALAAYAVLADPDRRASYDHHQQRGHGAAGVQQAPPGAVFPAHPTKTGVGPSWFAWVPRSGRPGRIHHPSGSAQSGGTETPPLEEPRKAKSNERGFRQVLRSQLWSGNLAPSSGAFRDLRRGAGHAGLVADDGFMNVELLVVLECPNEGEAAVRLREALDDVGLVTTPFRTTVINTLAEAEACDFVGSPTILIDGRDPFAAPEARPALACRVYPGVTGLVGVPPLREGVEGLGQAVVD